MPKAYGYAMSPRKLLASGVKSATKKVVKKKMAKKKMSKRMKY